MEAQNHTISAYQYNGWIIHLGVLRSNKLMKLIYQKRNDLRNYIDLNMYFQCKDHLFKANKNQIS